MSGTRDPGDPGIGPDPQPSDNSDEDIEEFDIPEDGNELDESELEEESEDLAAEPEPPPRQERRRGSETIQNLRARAQQAEVERDFYRSQTQQPRAPAPVDPRVQQEARRAEYQRISMLPPEEQIEALDQMMQRSAAITQLNIFDQNDRRDWQRMQSESPAARRLAGRVEELLQAERNVGVYTRTREQIFKYLYGEEVLSRGTRGADRQRRDGAARVARETTRPSRGGRGDVAGGGRRRGRTQDDIDRELLNTPIRDTM